VNEVISEFFYDGIRRILPGLLVLGLYANQQVARLFNDFKEFSVFLAIILVAAAWLIGIFIEFLTFPPVLPFWNSRPVQRFLSACPIFEPLLPQDNGKDPLDLLEESIAKLDLETKRLKRREIYKNQAEMILFRCCSGIFLVATVLGNPFPQFLYHRVMFFFAACFTLLAYLWQKERIRKRLHEWDPKRHAASPEI
jgi:hypothetical protein